MGDIAAVGELNRRMTRLRLLVMVPGFALALVGGALTSFPAAEASHASRDPMTTMGATFLVTASVILALAWGLYRALAIARSPRMIAEVAARHRVPADELTITLAPYREKRIQLSGPLRWIAYAALGAVLTALMIGLVALSVRP